MNPAAAKPTKAKPQPQKPQKQPKRPTRDDPETSDAAENENENEQQQQQQNEESPDERVDATKPKSGAVKTTRRAKQTTPQSSSSLVNKLLNSVLSCPNEQDPGVPIGQDASLSTNDLAVCAAVSAISLYVYVQTLYPTAPGGDGSELVTVALTFGCAHPPGYPLFSLLGYVFAHYVPFPESSIYYQRPAMRINLMSAIFGSLAAGFLAAACIRATRSRMAGFTAAMMFAFSPNVWLYAIGGEIFSFNNFFNTVLLDRIIHFHFHRTSLNGYVIAVVSGLSLCNQHTSVFPIFVYAMYVMTHHLYAEDGLGSINFLTVEYVIKYSMMAIAGLSPYIYLPIATKGSPMMNWGKLTDIYGLIHHFLRRDYGTFKLSVHQDPSIMDFFVRNKMFIENTLAEMGYIGLPICIVGLVSLYSRRNIVMRKLFWITFTAFAFYITIFNYLANVKLDIDLHVFIQQRFYPQAAIILFFFMAFGIKRIFENASDLKGACVVLVGFQIARNYYYMDMHDNYQIELYAKAALSKLPKNSLFLASGDLSVFGFRYVQLVEKYRTDVVVVDQEFLTHAWFYETQRQNYPRVIFPGERLGTHYNLSRFLTSNQNQFPSGIFSHGGLKQEDTSHKSTHKVIPLGVVEKVVPISHRMNPDTYAEKVMSWFPSEAELPTPNLDKFPKGSWEGFIKVIKSESHYAVAFHLLQSGIENNHVESLKKCTEVFIRQIEIEGQPPFYVYQNIGSAFSRLSYLVGEKDPNYTSYLQGVITYWSDYLRVADPNLSDYSKIRQSVLDVSNTLRVALDKKHEHKKPSKSGQEAELVEESDEDELTIDF